MIERRSGKDRRGHKDRRITQSQKVIEERNARICAAIEAGASQEDVGAYYGIGRDYVSSIFKQRTGKSVKDLRPNRRKV